MRTALADQYIAEARDLLRAAPASGLAARRREDHDRRALYESEEPMMSDELIELVHAHAGCW